MGYKIWTKDDVVKVLKEASEKVNYPCDKIPVVISKKLTTTGGYFTGIFTEVLGRKIYLRPHSFTFSYFYLNGVMKEDDVKQLILHEYCHFLTIDKSRESHGHDDLFKKNCKRVGCNIYDEAMLSYISDEPGKYRYEITCQQCDHKFGENRLEKNFFDKYACSLCGGEFKAKKNW